MGQAKNKFVTKEIVKNLFTNDYSNSEKQNVAVKGLGTAAYTASTAYDAAATEALSILKEDEKI